MSYQALYRAWRPATFAEIVGQDAIVETLKRQVETGRIAHAYLFSGTRGTGKTSAAKVFARAINCQNPQNAEPCGACESCRALKNENNMDVLEIDAASNNGVDEIRDLREKVKYPPVAAKYKVYIIDEVHMLSTGAFNALLKTLEEPPKHAVFILATTEPQKLPATILSRCQRFDFRRIQAATIVSRMQVVLRGIGRTATDAALFEIARACEGAMRDALSLLDMCLARVDGEVTESLVRDALGSVGREFLFDFCDFLLAEDARGALLKIDEMLMRGMDPQVFARDVCAHLRGILLAKDAPDAVCEILSCAQEDASRFKAQADLSDRQKIFRLMDLFLAAEPDMKWASSQRTILELCAARACHPENEGTDALCERIARLEKRVAGGVAVAKSADVSEADAAPFAAPEKNVPEVPSKAAPADEPEKSSRPAQAPAAQGAPGGYEEAVEKLAAQNVSIRQGLKAMRFVSLEDGVLTVEFPKNQIMFLRLLERKQAQIDEGFSAAMGQAVRVSMKVEGENRPAAGQTPAKKIIEQSYDVFGRENIDITD